MLLCCFKINILKKKIRNTIRVSNSLDPDQAQHFVGPDFGLNCLQRLSADNTSNIFPLEYYVNKITFSFEVIIILWT